MAILNSIRKRGIFLIIIIALALFAFIVSDSLTKGGGGPDIQDTVAVINGTELSRTDFMGKVKDYQDQLGGNTNQAQAIGVVWERELRSTLFQQQVEALGMTVSDDELKAELANVLSNDPTFQDENGFYSEALLADYERRLNENTPQAQQAKLRWTNYIDQVKRSILHNNYLAMVQGGMSTTLAEGEQQYRFENDKVDIEFVQIPYTKIADEDVVVSEDEIAAYVRNHPDDFEVEPLVDIQYVSYLEEPSLEDIEMKKDTITKLIPGLKSAENIELFVNQNSDINYDDRWYFNTDLQVAVSDSLIGTPVGEVYGPYRINDTYRISKIIESRQMPDSVKARHILIPEGLNRTDSITRTKEMAKTTADSLLRVLNANPSKFESLVEEMSGDLSSITNKGKFDWFNYTYFNAIPAFRDHVFTAEVGQMQVVETRAGYHIIEVEGRKNMQTVVKMATLSQEIEPSEKTLSDVFSEGAKFEEAARSGDFTAVATEKGLEPKPVNKLGKLDAAIPGVGPDRSIVNWAFEKDTKVGDVKRFNINQSYVIAQITRKSDKKALMSVAEASATVTPILRKEKKAAQIRASISGSILQEVAESQNVEVKNASALTRSNPTIADAGTEPAVVGAAFGLEVGKIAGPIDGENGVYYVQLLAKNKATDLANYGGFSKQLNTQAKGTINTGVYNALRKAADIEDNRSEFY